MGEPVGFLNGGVGKDLSVPVGAGEGAAKTEGAGDGAGALA